MSGATQQKTSFSLQPALERGQVYSLDPLSGRDGDARVPGAKPKKLTQGLARPMLAPALKPDRMEPPAPERHGPTGGTWRRHGSVWDREGYREGARSRPTTGKKYLIHSRRRKQLRNETARGSTAGFGGTGVCVGVRFVSLQSRTGREDSMVTNGDRKTLQQFWKVGPAKSWSFFEKLVARKPCRGLLSTWPRSMMRRPTL